MTDPPEITILLLGDAEVGKSTFLSRISKGLAVQSSSSPISLLRDGDQPFIFDIQFSSQPYRLEFYDTSSPENWTLLHPNVIVLCYDISSRLSLINTQRQWSKQIYTTWPEREDLPVMLLGLKRDLRSEKDPNGIIYPQEAYRIAQELRLDKYLECSALTGELMSEVWEDVCRTAAATVGKGGGQGGGKSEGGCEVM